MEALPDAEYLLVDLFDELPGAVVVAALQDAKGCFEIACCKLLATRQAHRLRIHANPECLPLLPPGKEDGDDAPRRRDPPTAEKTPPRAPSEKREKVRLHLIEAYSRLGRQAKVREVDELMKRATQDKEESMLTVLRYKYGDGDAPPRSEPKGSPPAPPPPPPARSRWDTVKLAEVEEEEASAPRAASSEALRLVSQSSPDAGDGGGGGPSLRRAKDWLFWPRRKRLARLQGDDRAVFTLRNSYLQRLDGGAGAADGALVSIHVATIVGLRPPRSWRSRSLGPTGGPDRATQHEDQILLEVLTPAARYAFSSARAPAWVLELRSAAWGAKTPIAKLHAKARDRGWIAPAGRTALALRALKATSAA